MQNIYYPGDEIAIRMQFQHNGNIERIEATFVHKDVPAYPTVELTETRKNPEVYRRPSMDDLTAVNYAYLSAEIQSEVQAGIYRCASLLATLYGGREVEFATKPSFTFEVAEQPQQAPSLMNFEPVALEEADGFPRR